MSTTTNPTPKAIRPALPTARTTPVDLLAVGNAVDTGLTGNNYFTALPTDLATLKTDLANLQTANAASLDGGKSAIAQRDKIELGIRQKLSLLGHYVSIVSNGDLAIFTSSGFAPAPAFVRTAAHPLVQATVRSIKHGTSGQVLVTLTTVAKAKSYELRYAAVANGVPGAWTTIPVATVRPATAISGLTPGTLYAFQVRALGTAGYTDWSDSSTFMCT